MANNLSSNQQYLLSMIQQNNPEILYKFLNEDAPQAVPGRKNQPTPTETKPSRDSMLDRYADPQKDLEREISRQDKAAKHYSEVIGSLPSDPSKLSAKQAAEVAMYKIMSKSGPGSENLKDRVEFANPENTAKLSSMDSDVLRNRSVTTGVNNSPSTQSKVALRYQKKAEENALPLGDRPISPFYQTTRNQFRAEFGRDFDASGGATPANMRGLVNIKTNLAGRLKDIESGWQDKMAWEAQLAAGQKYKNPFAKMAATLVAKTKAEQENPVHDYVASDFDVPEIRRPGEPEGTERTLPTQPVDTGRKTEWIFSDQYNSPSTDKTQASNLSGKSVNQKINRIA